MYIGHPKKVYDFSLQQLLYILRMVQNCQSIINQLALAIGQAKHRRELLLFKNHPNVPIMSKKITNICTFQLLKLNQEECICLTLIVIKVSERKKKTMNVIFQ